MYQPCGSELAQCQNHGLHKLPITALIGWTHESMQIRLCMQTASTKTTCKENPTPHQDVGLGTVQQSTPREVPLRHRPRSNRQTWDPKVLSDIQLHHHSVSSTSINAQYYPRQKKNCIQHSYLAIPGPGECCYWYHTTLLQEVLRS